MYRHTELLVLRDLGTICWQEHIFHLDIVVDFVDFMINLYGIYTAIQSFVELEVISEIICQTFYTLLVI